MAFTKADKTELTSRIKGSIPHEASHIASLLLRSGHDVQLVGGCIRDIALGRQPHDWDMTTSAAISDVSDIMSQSGIKTINTGLKHGTITAVSNGERYEITEYRTISDDEPRTLETDLRHRDFTINAIAYDIGTSSLLDPLNGLHDILRKTIRAVGDANERFDEDGLRVLRAVRQAAELGFSIDYRTSQSMHDMHRLISDTVVERQTSELRRLLVSDTCHLHRILLEYPDIIAEIIPEIAPCIGFPQYTKWHCYDVYRHMVEVCCGVEPVFPLRLAALLHDIGKPCSEVYKDGRQHFYGHQEPSARIASNVCERLRIDSNTSATIVNLVRHHDEMTYPVTEKGVRRMAARLGGREAFDGWYTIRLADILAHDESAWHSESRGIECCDAIKAVYDDMDEKGLTLNVRELDIDGNDLIGIGYNEGPEIGQELKHLLNAVIDGDIANEYDELFHAANDDFQSNV